MSMKKTIIKLLYQYDCVIVPDLGGFVAKHNTARFNPMEYTFEPPAKQVGFNSDLSHTDGLLANEIATEKGISYKEACELINNEVSLWLHQLNRGETLKINGLGELSKENGVLNFTSSVHANFSLNTYGLDTVKAKYILRKEKEQPKESNQWVSYAAAFALAIGVGAFSFFANNNLVQPQLSSILPINFAKTAQTEMVAPVIEIEKTDNTLKIEKESVKEETPTIKHYQVIGGSFRKYYEAMKGEATMKRQGYDNAVIIGKVGSFFMVAYDTFDTYEEALAYKRKLEESGKDVFVRP